MMPMSLTTRIDSGDQDDSDFEDLEVDAEYDFALIKEQFATPERQHNGHLMVAGESQSIRNTHSADV